MMHTATLRSLGGSVAVTLPKAMLTPLGLGVGSQVDLFLDEHGIKLVPEKRKKYTLDQLLAMQNDVPFLIDKEWDAMPAVGNEVAI